MAFGRDVDFHDAYPQSTYLDRLTGDIIWLYDEDDDAYIEVGVASEENRADRERVASDLHRYLEIPGLDHGDHHDILRRFLHSEWTEGAALRARAAEVYSGSIGRWKRDVRDDDAVQAFHAFREVHITRLAEQFLLDNGMKPQWR